MIRNPIDPAATYQAAAQFVPLIIRGLLTVPECVPPLLHHAKLRNYRGDLSGLQARITWELRDQVSAAQSARNRAESFIRRDARDAMEKLVKSAVILKEAQRSNIRQGSPFLPEEVRGIVADALADWLKRRQWRHG